MADMAALRQGVRESLPELDDVQNADLRDKVVEAFALALSQTEFERIEDMRPSGNYNTPAMTRGSQARTLDLAGLAALRDSARSTTSRPGSRGPKPDETRTVIASTGFGESRVAIRKHRAGADRTLVPFLRSRRINGTATGCLLHHRRSARNRPA